MLIRNVLVVDRQGAVFAAIGRCMPVNFCLHRATNLVEAKQMLCCRSYDVGVMLFEPVGCGDRHEFERGIGAAQVEWIAILTDELLGQRGCRTLISNFFCDYHRLPVDMERLALAIGHAAGMADLRRSHDAGDDDLPGRFGLVGASAPMLKLYRQIEKVVAADEPVLLHGESGTGKELVAKAIHHHSMSANAPFLPVDCGAIAPSLIQSELFGHEKGAFTGADRRKIGKIETADGGVLFLDEIGDLPLSLQTNLLRFLQERTIIRVGGREPVGVNVRVIAATHVDLHRAVAQGRFRQDLYYRLNVLQLTLPPLRMRGGDVSLMAEAFFDEQTRAQKGRTKARGFSTGAYRAIAAHDWPGNVRELLNRVKRAVILSENRLLTAADLGLDNCLPSSDSSPTLEAARIDVERDVVESTLRKNNFNITQAARELGISRVTVYRMIGKLKIDRARSAAQLEHANT